MVSDIYRFSDFVTSSDFLGFEIRRVFDFPISSEWLDREIPRFFDFAFSPDFQDSEISPFADFLFSGLVDVWLFGLFDFLGFSVFGCPTFSGIVDSTITEMLLSLSRRQVSATRLPQKCI